MEEQKINPNHGSVRSVLRIAGPLLLLSGIVFIAVGMISFFSSFGGLEPPRYFWCCFVGGPLLVLGIWITTAAYAGAMARYVAAESAPVSKDTFNYMAKETKSGVRDIASAIAEGITGTERACKVCDAKNDTNAKFCDNCGKALLPAKT